MAQVANPRNGFNFRITLMNSRGIILNNFLVQEVNLPEPSVDSVEHGDMNYLVKTGGLKKYGAMKIKKICPADLTGLLDNFIWSWISDVQNENLGGGELPSIYKKTVRVEQLGTDGFSVLSTNTYEGCWPIRVNGIDLSRMQSSNIIEEFELSVDRMIRI